MQVVPVEEPPAPALEAVVRAGTVAGARAPPPLHEICDALKRNLGLDGTFSEVINAACLQLGVPPTGGLREKGNACWRAMVVGDEEGVITEQPSASEGRDGGRGSIESLGRYEGSGRQSAQLRFNYGRPRGFPEKETKAWIPEKEDQEDKVRVGFIQFINMLVQRGASSGTFALSTWTHLHVPDAYGQVKHGRYLYLGINWRRGYKYYGRSVGTSTTHGNIRFADFEGAIGDWGEINQNIMAVYRVTLPRRGLDPDKWVGRPPPPAPEELYTGPRSDGLLSTEEISGDYSAACICAGDYPTICNSMTVVPHGADAIETWRSGCLFGPPCIAPMAGGGVWTRKPGTNAFLNPQMPHPNNVMTFSADGTATQRGGVYKKRPGSQKRAFQKVDARDLAGKWCGCAWMPPIVYCCYTTKKALNQDQYAESGLCCCFMGLPSPYCGGGTRTRKYVNGHPTNGFALDGKLEHLVIEKAKLDRDPGKPDEILWYRDPGCAANGCFFAKKVG